MAGGGGWWYDGQWPVDIVCGTPDEWRGRLTGAAFPTDKFLRCDKVLLALRVRGDVHIGARVRREDELRHRGANLR